MAAPKGNEFWLARSKSGPKGHYTDPAELWADCCEYFQWVEDNPLWESRVASNKGEPVVLTLPKMRAMTIQGLCLFLEISHDSWADWRKREDLSEIVARVDQIIYSQKFAGAAADLLNPNIIARDLGLADKSESVSRHHHTVSSEPLSEEEWAKQHTES
jgi:hypothetical protein